MNVNNYPYGKAALLILLLAFVSGIIHFALSTQRRSGRPDLVMAIFAPNHEEAYRQVLPAFEKKHGVKVEELKTQDDFVAMVQRVVKDLDGDGNPDRYALDTPMAADWAIKILLLQRGGEGGKRVEFFLLHRLKADQALRQAQDRRSELPGN